MKSTAVSNSACRLGDEIEHLGLDGRVEAGRRLVEDQQRGVLRERHRDHDALLHAAGELVRVAAHHARRVGDLHLDERLASALRRFLAGHAEHRERLGDLRADPQARVQRGAGVLVDHRDGSGVVLAQSLASRARDVAPGDRDPAARDAAVARQVADDSERRGRLPAAGLADEPVRAAALDRERHAAEDGPVDAAHAVDQLEVVDARGRCPSRRRSSLVRLANAVGDEVDGDDEARDRERREQRHPPVGVDQRPVLVDLRRPSRRRRLRHRSRGSRGWRRRRSHSRAGP